MAQNNVFQMLAQQEIDRPQRKLSELQTKVAQMQYDKAKEEQDYQSKFKLAMAGGSLSQGQPDPTSFTRSMGGQWTQNGQPVSDAALPISPSVAGLSLSNMGAPAATPQPQAAQQLSIVDQFKRQYEFHTQNGRADLAQQVMEHQIDLSSKAAKVAEHAFKTGGKEGLVAWLKSNPAFAPLLGDPSHMQLTKDGVLFPATDEKGQPVPGMFWYRGADGNVQWKEIKPEPVQTFAPGVGIPDGKGGYTIPVPKEDASSKPFAREYEEGDTKITELYDAKGNLTGTKKAPRYKPTAPATDKTDAIVAREAVKDLPKLRREARTAEASKPRLQQMVKLIDSGAGGIKGNALAAISGIFDTPATSEAELFKKLAAAGAGQLRSSVIGPGAVSNYEQSLLQAISGGGNGARTATRQLLKYYEQEADRTISNYNDAVDSAVTVAPKAAKGFGKLGAKKNDPLGIL